MTTCRIVFAVIVLTALINFAALADEPKIESSRPAPNLVIVLKRGETKEALLTWAHVIGRSPVVFLQSHPHLCPRRQKDFSGDEKINSLGLTVEFDEKESETVQAELNISEYDSGSKQVITAAAIRVSSAEDATPGVQSVYLHIVSDTGRNMLLSGEVRIIVR